MILSQNGKVKANDGSTQYSGSWSILEKRSSYKDGKSSSSASTNSDSSSNTDRMLDEFEEFLDTYLELMEEYNDDTSDMDLMLEFFELTEEYQEFIEELFGLQLDMNRRQLKRFENLIEEYDEKLMEYM
jgi:hypothetical protein